VIRERRAGFATGRSIAGLALAAVTSASLMWPAAASAGTVSSAAQRLTQLRQSFAGARSTYRGAENRWADTHYRLERTRKQYEKNRRQLVHAQWLLKMRVSHIYRSSGAGVIDVVLGATDFEDFITGIDFLSRIGRADSELIGDLKLLKLKMRAQKSSLSSLESAQRARKNELARQATQLESDLAAQAELYQRLKSAAAMEARARSIGGRGGSAPVHLSQGFQFPVAGPHSFGDDWGNPRSGGRTHKGTDIFASRGTPCVACVSGSVEANEGGLGGRTIWLHGSDGNDYYYAHLDGWAVTSGSVSAGQVIGYVGNTGNAAGGACHLHFGIEVGGEWRNPYPTLAAAG
jgi:murein DD-endopeptidase MepM/ murein hydrolase activator NlpD